MSLKMMWAVTVCLGALLPIAVQGRSFKAESMLISESHDARIGRVSLKSEAGTGVGDGTTDFITGWPTDYNRMCRCKSCGGKNDYCGVIPVHVEVRLEHLHKIEDIERAAKVSIIVVSEWYDDRLNTLDYSGRIEEGEIGYPLWTPDLEIRNQREPAEELESEMRLNPPGSKRGTVRHAVRLEASVVDKFDEWAYPFDEHTLNVTIASFAYSAKEVLLKTTALIEKEREAEGQHTGDEYPTNPEWEVKNITMLDVIEGSTFAEEDSYVKMRISVARYYNSPIMNLISPVIAIVLFSTSAFFIKPSALSDRINVAAIGFLTIMAYTYVVAEQLPRVSYMLWIHWFIIVSYATVLWVTVLVIWHHVEDTRNKGNNAKKTVHPNVLKKVNKWAGYLTPVVYMAMVAILFVYNRVRR